MNDNGNDTEDAGVVQRELVTCTKCDGEGTETTLGPPEGWLDKTLTMEDLAQIEVECRRCGGRGTEYEGSGCPQCGAESDALSSSLMPSSSYKINCPNCPWWELV